MNKNNNIQMIEENILNSISRSSRFISKKNDIFNNIFENLFNNIIRSKNKNVETEINDYFYTYNIDVKNLDIDKEYTKLIKFLIIKYYILEYNFDSTILKSFKFGDWGKSLYTHLDEIEHSDYHSSHYDYEFKIQLSTPEFIQQCNKYLSNYEIALDGKIMLKNDNISLLNYILYQNIDFKDNINLTEDFNNLKNAYNEIIDIITNINKLI